MFAYQKVDYTLKKHDENAVPIMERITVKTCLGLETAVVWTREKEGIALSEVSFTSYNPRITFHLRNADPSRCLTFPLPSSLIHYSCSHSFSKSFLLSHRPLYLLPITFIVVAP